METTPDGKAYGDLKAHIRHLRAVINGILDSEPECGAFLIVDPFNVRGELSYMVSNAEASRLSPEGHALHGYSAILKALDMDSLDGWEWAVVVPVAAVTAPLADGAKRPAKDLSPHLVIGVSLGDEVLPSGQFFVAPLTGGRIAEDAPWGNVPLTSMYPVDAATGGAF